MQQIIVFELSFLVVAGGFFLSDIFTAGVLVNFEEVRKIVINKSARVKKRSW